MEVISKILTFDDLVLKLQNLGLKKGMIVEVHTSMSKLGFVLGGAKTIVDALIEVVGYSGTIIMPMHASNNSEPSRWINPPCEISIINTIRENTPGFDKKTSDANWMGKVLDNFRRRDGVCISSSPCLAYIAWGKYAKLLCNRQSTHFPLSEESATARLYEMKAYCLLLGCDFDRATCLHLSEYRSDVRPIIIEGAAKVQNDRTVWKKYLDIDLNSDDFMEIGKVMEAKGYVSKVEINDSMCKLFRVDVGVDESVRYFENHNVNLLYRW